MKIQISKVAYILLIFKTLYYISSICYTEVIDDVLTGLGIIVSIVCILLNRHSNKSMIYMSIICMMGKKY